VQSHLTTQERAIHQQARDFVSRHLPLDVVLQADREARFPMDIWRVMAAEAWPARFIARPWGDGAPLGMLVAALEGLAYGDITLTSALQRTACFGGHLLEQWAEPALQERLLPVIASGDALISFALTEQEAGSDAAALRCQARRADGGYVLTGTKIYTGGAQVAHTILVAARMEGTSGKEGITLFAVPAGAPGLDIQPMDTLGHRGVGVATVRLAEVPVEAGAVVGPPGAGWDVIMSSVGRERLQVAAICIGAAERVLDLAVEHAGRRVQFGRRLVDFQAIQHHLTDMGMLLESAREMLHETVARAELEGDDPPRSILAKLVATEAFWQIADRGLQVAGGTGYLLDSYFQFALREARLYRIGGGTSEVLRTVVGRHLAKGMNTSPW
jgi:alkylation response protein AidB-like acyl-CoA dehydrogenase